MNEAQGRHILVKGGKAGLPFSKGLMASSILATGLEPSEAHRVAERIESELRAGGRREVTVEELRSVAAETLEREIGTEAATRYRQWQRVQERSLPLLLLIGGATGAGKSTVATQVAQRLGITRIISTDAIREIMRTTSSPKLSPALHVSSFETAEAIALSPGPEGDEGELLIQGFLRQTEGVTVGIEHILERAVEEGVNTVVEGVHVVPGTLDLPRDAIVVQVLLHVDEEDRHRSHLDSRSQRHPDRPKQRYLDHLSEIRRIQDELVRRAESADVPVVSTYALDQTVAEVTRLVVNEVTRQQLAADTDGPRPEPTRPRRSRSARQRDR